ncbi:hypothetical protein [uncultured Microbulbifer sp.]|uniref:hypothetical protein n=1 Tax=uncultured Microbulbifer sp. TaxID=348147 RepID=UPI0026374482|nr:hypothetical protein [uncultured Microbulbifer sp.]
MILADENMDIIPHVGLGGIKLGDFLGDLKITKNEIKVVNSQKMAVLNDGAIFILFSKDSKVIQLSARDGYKGKLLGIYSVGESILNFVNSNDWFFSESDDGFINDNVPGVVVHPNLEDATPEEIVGKKNLLTVAEITVS